MVIVGFIACRPVDWSLVGPFLPDRPQCPVDIHSIEASCALCGIPVWVEPALQVRRPFGPVICFLCAIFTTFDASQAGRTAT